MKQPPTLHCFVCEAEMTNLDEERNQPLGGTAFISQGHYGSTVFDPMDGTFLELNICDACLRAASQKRLVLHVSHNTKTTVIFRVWEG